MAITLVVDSSVTIKWFVAEINSAEALAIHSKYRSGDIQITAPELINVEVANAIWRKQTREGMAATGAHQVLVDLLSSGLDLVPNAGLLEDAYQLAVTHDRSIYDALYLALSEREGC
jgi:predicted nucleic acid-binding protein